MSKTQAGDTLVVLRGVSIDPVRGGGHFKPPNQLHFDADRKLLKAFASPPPDTVNRLPPDSNQSQLVFACEHKSPMVWVQLDVGIIGDVELHL